MATVHQFYSEVTSRLAQLQRQAANAEKFKQFKQEERQLKAELLGLSEELGADLGLAKREIANSPDDRVVEASIGPSHPAIGQQLTDIPFLNRSGARVLGVSRPRHHPAPRSKPCASAPLTNS
jgi:hypothetical protein